MPNPSPAALHRWFWFFIVLQVIAWTAIPTWLRHALPMDAVEGAVWGQQFELGYDKNPWLNAWLTHFALVIGGNSGWAVYALSQLCVAIAIWSVWRLGRKLLSPTHAVIAALMLSAIQYYNIAAVDFNDNVLELALWPLLALLFYRALTLAQLRDWLAVGVIAGLALMAKYYSAIFFCAMLLFLLVDPQARQSFRSKNLYLALTVFILIVLPHFVWLLHNDFAPIHYAAMRVSANTNFDFWQHIKPSITFGIIQLLNFAGAIVLLLCSLLARVKDPALTTKNTVSKFDKRFLWMIGVAPFVITLLLGLVSGWQLHILWGTPLLSLWGLLLLIYWQPTLNKTRVIYFLSAVFLVFSLTLVSYSISLTKVDKLSSANFPAKKFANLANQIWHKHYAQPLQFIAGDRYLAGYIAIYSVHKPKIYMEWNSEKSPWINEQQLRMQGALFVQPISSGKQFPSNILQRFPELELLPIIYLKPIHADNRAKPFGILMGLLPPH